MSCSVERAAVVLAAQRVVLLRPMVDDPYLMCSAYAASQQGASDSVNFVFHSRFTIAVECDNKRHLGLLVLTGTVLVVTLSGELKSFLC